MAPSPAATRFVGLSGSWGTFKMGHFSAPVRRHHRHPGQQHAQYRHSRDRRNLWAQATQERRTRPTPAAFRHPAGELDSLRFAELGGIRVLRAIRDGRRSSPRCGQPPARATIPAVAIPATATQSYRYINGPFTGFIAYEFHNNIRGASQCEPGRLGILDRCPVAIQRVQHRRQVRMAGLRRHAVDRPQAQVLAVEFDDQHRRQRRTLY